MCAYRDLTSIPRSTTQTMTFAPAIPSTRQVYSGSSLGEATSANLCFEVNTSTTTRHVSSLKPFQSPSEVDIRASKRSVFLSKNGKSQPASGSGNHAQTPRCCSVRLGLPATFRSHCHKPIRERAVRIPGEILWID